MNLLYFDQPASTYFSVTAYRAQMCRHGYRLLRSGKLFAELGQHNLAGVDENDTHLLWRELRVVTERFVNEVVYSPDGLDTGEAAAGDDGRQHPLADGGVGLEARRLQNPEYAGAEQRGVAKGLQRHGVLGHALHPEKVGLRAHGEPEVIIVEVQRARVAGAVHPLRGQVN